ncbi:MAG: hypothetical protein ABDH91_00065 [Bacteroidia bacterium]
MWIMKVGGGCLRSADAFAQLPYILRHIYPEKPRLLVVSAIGKTTNHLLELVRLAEQGAEAALASRYADLQKFHQQLIQQLLPATLADSLWNDLTKRYWNPLWQRLQALLQLGDESPSAVDGVLVYGELISSEIVRAFLQSQGFALEWVDARQLLVTDGHYPEPNVIESLSQANVDALLVPLFRTHGLVITQGYIASDLRRRSVTLGREGSDYSAALFARLLRAEGMIAWKDVGGIYAADPRQDPQAQPLPQLSYSQAAEMTYYGAKVLHPRTLRPLWEGGIPLYVRPYFSPEAEGTCISPKEASHLPPIHTRCSGLTLIEVCSTDLTPIASSHLIQGLEREGALIYFFQGGMRTAALAVKAAPEILDRWRTTLPAGWEVRWRAPFALYTILYPESSAVIPNGEALYLQRLPDRLHWLAYEG